MSKEEGISAMMKITSKIKNYEVGMVDDLLSKRDEILRKFSYDRLFFFIDKNVYEQYEKQLALFIGNDCFFLIDASESNKEYSHLAEYYDLLIENRFTRNDILIAIGGGIIQDISGFIASTLYRGIHWIFIPTTLLAQADSCIGSKTSINFGSRKNLIGTFCPGCDLHRHGFLRDPDAGIFQQRSGRDHQVPPPGRPETVRSPEKISGIKRPAFPAGIEEDHLVNAED